MAIADWLGSRGIGRSGPTLSKSRLLISIASSTRHRRQARLFEERCCVHPCTRHQRSRITGLLNNAVAQQYVAAEDLQRSD